jgi:hypothetical protein
MTLKTGMVAATFAAGLLAGASQAKADVVRVNARPAHAAHDGRYVRRAPRPSWRGYPAYGYGYRYDYGYRPVVVAPPPAPAVALSYGARYTYGAPDPQDPSFVATQIRAEMNQAADDLRFDVRQGVVEPRALASLEADRQEIERDLASASAKGYITPEDRAHLEQHVQEIRDLRVQLRCAISPPSA